MAAITNVSALNGNIRTTFDTVRQSMPTIETAEAFLTSHQVAIAQLAIEYCNALVEDTGLRATMFPGFQFGANVATAWDSGAGESAFIDPLLNRVLGQPGFELTSQPLRADMESELFELVHGIAGDAGRLGLANGGGDQVRTRTIAKAVCSAVLGSGAMLIQ
jgi:hypothetical protein